MTKLKPEMLEAIFKRFAITMASKTTVAIAETINEQLGQRAAAPPDLSWLKAMASAGARKADRDEAAKLLAALSPAPGLREKEI